MDAEKVDKEKEISTGTPSPTQSEHEHAHEHELTTHPDSKLSPIASPSAPTSSPTYRYLEFETKPPHVNPPANAPPPPDLRRYVSPFEWPATKKMFIVWVSTVSTGLAAYTAGSYASGVDQMSAEWGVSTVAALVGITVYTAGFATGPMVMAPFSELNGRQPVFIVTGIIFVVTQACCAITRIYAGMLVARFFTGVAASTFSTMVGGVLSDMYHASNRNKPMAIYTGGVFFGTGLGPLVSGFIAQHLDWRWIFYVQIIGCGIVMAVVVLFFPETRGSVLLSRKARKLNEWYDACDAAAQQTNTAPSLPSPNFRWKVLADEERGTLAKMLTVSLFRPFHLLFTEPVVFFFSCWISFSWAVLYLTFDAIPLVYERTYGFNLQETGAVFAVIIVVSVLFTCVNIWQEKIVGQLSQQQDPSTTSSTETTRRNLTSLLRVRGTPEDRLMFPCVEAIMLPLGLFWFGWTLYPSVHWIASVLALGCATMGIMAIYLCVFNYLADTYHRYASSAIAAQSFCRNMLGGAFPLFTEQMFTRLGFHAASSMLGGIGLVLTLVPWVLLFYGVQIRARSKFASEIMKT